MDGDAGATGSRRLLRHARIRPEVLSDEASGGRRTTSTARERLIVY
jgi:hypothetical protein